MLLIDGVRYNLWTPPNEDEFERVVKEHTEEIFGENSIYLDIKQRLKSDAGTIVIPDGCAIVFDKSRQWHIVEMELSSHTRQHYVSQLSGIISGINNPTTQKKIFGVIHKEITTNNLLKFKLAEAIKPMEVHEFLYGLTSLQPVLTIPIEKDTPVLRDVIKTLNYPQDKIKVVEFQTFTGEGPETVHAHLFEPLYIIKNVILHLRVKTKDDPQEIESRFTGAFDDWKEVESTSLGEVTRVKGDIKDVTVNVQVNTKDSNDIIEGWFKGAFDDWEEVEGITVEVLDEWPTPLAGKKSTPNLAKPGKPVDTAISPMRELEVELYWANCINYHYLPVSDDQRFFFPETKIPFTFETNLGDINTNVAGGGTTKSISYIQRNLKKWFEAHPELKKGDKVRITVIEPMKRYHLEIVL